MRALAGGIKPRVVVGLVIGLLVVALTAVTVAWATSPPSAATTYTGCLGTSSGTLTNIKKGGAPLNACPTGASQIKLSGGDITAVSAGTGLVGGASKGAAALSLDPGYQLPQWCGTGESPIQASGWKCGDQRSLQFNNHDITQDTTAVVNVGDFYLQLTCNAHNATLSTLSEEGDGTVNLAYIDLDGASQFNSAHDIGSTTLVQNPGGTGTLVWEANSGDVVTSTLTWYWNPNTNLCEWYGSMLQAQTQL